MAWTGVENSRKMAGLTSIRSGRCFPRGWLPYFAAPCFLFSTLFPYSFHPPSSVSNFIQDSLLRVPHYSRSLTIRPIRSASTQRIAIQFTSAAPLAAEKLRHRKMADASAPVNSAGKLLLLPVQLHDQNLQKSIVAVFCHFTGLQ